MDRSLGHFLSIKLQENPAAQVCVQKYNILLQKLKKGVFVKNKYLKLANNPFSQLISF